MYVFLYLELKKSQQGMEKCVKKVSTQTILIQIVVTLTSNTLTWIPSGVIYISAMIMSQYPMEMMIWVLIAVAPINAIVNPIMFIRTALKK